MPIYLIDKIKQKNQGTFKLVDAKDVETENKSNVESELSRLDNAIKSTDTNIDKKQDKLVSGTNIKTINNESILGGGNLEVGGVKLVDSLPTASEAKPTTIYAVGYNENMDFYIVKRPLPKLDTPEVYAQGNIINWQNVHSAQKYKIYANDTLISDNIIETTIDLSTNDVWNGLPDSTYTIKVIASAEYYTDSDAGTIKIVKDKNKYSAEFTIDVIGSASGTPTICQTINNGVTVYEFDASTESSSFTTTINLTLNTSTTFQTDNYNADVTVYVKGESGRAEYLFSSGKSYTYNGKITKITWEIYD